MRRWIIFLALTAALGGCGLDDTLHRMDLATFRRQCEEFGFTPGTTSFASCMQKQAALRENQDQHIVDQINRQDAAKKK